ncbi:DUF5131 family protein [Hoylesella oralis]|uniref:DUF5131 family protein n=1 Tax=Hoylesella oralis TaxID=28134 RepID=UPI0035AC11AA
MNLKGIDRATVGGECNTLAQLMRKEWVVKLKEQVEKQGTTFFFKQWGIWESDSIKYNKHVNRKMLYE